MAGTNLPGSTEEVEVPQSIVEQAQSSKGARSRMQVKIPSVGDLGSERQISNYAKRLKEARTKLAPLIGTEAFINYDLLRNVAEHGQHINKGAGLTKVTPIAEPPTPGSPGDEFFFEQWFLELQRVRRVTEDLLHGRTYCNIGIGPLRLSCGRNQLQPKVVEAVVECINLNREGFRRIAKRYGKQRESELQSDRTEAFDIVMGFAMDEAEHQMMMGSSFRSKKVRLLQLGALVVITVIVAVSLAATQASPLEVTFVLGLAAGFITAWGNSANDIANSVGTAVGGGAFTLAQAVVYGAIFEVIGCLTMGPFVSKSIVKGIIDTSDYEATPGLYAFGMCATLFGAGLTTLLATMYGYPISATHGIIGGLIAVGITAKGADSVGWDTVGITAIGWVASPFVGCVVSMGLYALIHFTVYTAKQPERRSKMMQPVFIWLCLAIQVLFVLMKGPKALQAKTWIADAGIEWISGTPLAIILAVIGGWLLVPLFYLGAWLRRKSAARAGSTPGILSKSTTRLAATFGFDEAEKPEPTSPSVFEFRKVAASPTAFSTPTAWDDEPDSPGSPTMQKFKPAGDSGGQKQAGHSVSEQAFVPLLIISALSVAVAHGGNDVGNSVGPLSAIFMVWDEGQVAAAPSIPLWALLFGSFGFVLGILTMGRLTIKTVGTKLTTLTPSKSFATQMGAAISVLGSSALGLPVSTSHCLVGSVVGIGIFETVMKTGKLNVGVLSRIALAWVITIPLSMLVAWVIFAPFQHIFD